jgi:curved DNA-binding protein CbpA
VLVIVRKAKTLYEVLEVPENASTNEIKRSYKRLASIHHPDKVANIDDPELLERAEEELIKINNAKDILLDPKKRGEYDLLLSLFKSGSRHPNTSPESSLENSFDIELELSSNDDDFDDFDIEWEFDSSYSEVDFELSEDDIETTINPVYVEEPVPRPQDSKPSDFIKIQRRFLTFCPSCGEENLTGRSSCLKCNTSLVISEDPQHSPEPKVDTGPMKVQERFNIRECPNCGAKNFNDSHYCYFCNIDLVSFQKPITLGSTQPHEPNKDERDPKLITCYKCGAGNLVGTEYCRICYTKLFLYQGRTTQSQPVYTPPITPDTRPKEALEYQECPHCGSENPTYYSICQSCFKNLPSNHEKIIKRRTPDHKRGDSEVKIIYHDKVTCPNCGAEIVNNQSSCHLCGLNFPLFYKSK